MRRIRVFGSYRNLAAAAVDGLDVVIVDVLRATTTIAFAVASGARVLPLASVEAALARGRALGARAIVVGERDGLRLPGCDCNNSPTELAALPLRGKIVVLTTTNGTPAVAACARARRIFAGALTNAPALGAQLCGRGGLARDLAIVCAGRATGALALEDLLGAGAVAAAVVAASRRAGAPAPWLADSARLASEQFRSARARLDAALRRTDAGRELIARANRADVAAAAAYGTVTAVPRMKGEMFVAA